MDADETIFDFPVCEYNALKEALGFYGIVFNDEVYSSFSSINAALWKKLELKEITKPALRIRRFSEMLEKCFPESEAVKPALLAEKYIERLAGQAVFTEGAYQALEKLSRCYDIYIITNGFSTVQKSRISLSGIRPFLKGVFISEELGADKPEKLFFEKALESVKEKDHSRILVVGDSITSDMQGGKNAGLTTCIYDPKGKISMPHPLCDFRVRSLMEIPDLPEISL